MKILIAFLLCVAPVLARAQSIISGEISDAENGGALEGAIIKISTINNDLIAYTSSIKDGSYKIKLYTSEKEFFLSVSFLGYKTVSVKIANQSSIKDFALQTDAIMLREVYVKPPAITKVGDTLTYRVDHFKREQDRSISDVLKKMPGIEIGETGSISYQGKPISKFYIEGIDLLGKKYSLASNSIPPDAIGSVQIYENHQPIKALNGLTYSDRAALNLVLKDKKRIKPVGYMEGGIGGMKDELLWSADFFSLFLAAQRQSLFSYKSNNTGSLLTDLQEEQGINVEDIEKGLLMTPENLFADISFAELPINADRYHFNRSHLLNYNQLWKKNNLQWRIVASYINESNKQKVYLDKDYILPDDEHYLIVEDNMKQVKNNKAAIEISQELNTEKLFMSNSTNISADWQNQSSEIMSNISTNVQKFSMPTFNLQNNMTMVKRLKSNALSFYSYIRYTNQPQDFNLKKRMEDLGLMDQSAKRSMLYMVNGTDFSISYLKSVFILGAKFYASVNSYKTQNNSSFVTSMGYNDTNRLKDDKYEIQLHPQYNYTPNKMKLKISMPVSYTYYKCNNMERNIRKKNHKWIFEPSVLFRFDITNYWNTSINYSHKKQLGGILDFVDSPVMKNYQMAQLGSETLEERGSDTFGFQLAYRNQLDALFFHLSAIYRPMTINTISGNQFTDNYIIAYKLPQYNDRNMKIITSSLAKFIDCLNANFSITAGYTETESSLYQQQKLYPLDMKAYRIETKVDGKIASWLNIETKILWSKSLLNDKDNPTRKSEYIRSNIIGYFFPTKYMQLSLSTEYSHTKNGIENSTHYLFADAKANYKKNKWEVELLYQNIFNHKRYENISYSELSSSYTSFPLRGASLFAILRYNF